MHIMHFPILTSKVDIKQTIRVRFLHIKLDYEKPVFIAALEKMFDEVKQNHPQYSNVAVEIYKYANDGDYDHGDPEAGALFEGDRLETDAEYVARLESERKARERALLREQKEELARKQKAQKVEEWERQEYARLKQKYEKVHKNEV